MSQLEVSCSTQVKLVIFDWAGTIIDFGCQAPVIVLQRLFDLQGVPITDAEARGPMGVAKRDHIEAILAMSSVHERWADRFGAAPCVADLDRLYHDFLPLQKSILAEYSQPIPGAREVFEQLKAAGITIGSTTGYTRELMEIVVPIAASYGLSPDVVVTSDEVPRGRPAPDMIQKVMRFAEVIDPAEVVKVDDTIVGIEAAANAHCRSVAVIGSGNSLGLTELQYLELTEVERESLSSPVRQQFEQAGADYVIDTVADLMEVLEIIG
jgi:phosphonoacetaldehyde hydrolase